MILTSLQELVGHVIRSCGLQENTSNNTTVSVSPSARSAQTDLTGQYVRILDLCCGSGAIAVSLLKECPLVSEGMTGGERGGRGVGA